VKKIILGLILVFLTIGSFSAFFWYQLQPVASSPESGWQFTITKNQTASSILADLQSKGIIRSALAAKIYLKLTRQETHMSPGGYQVSRLSTPQVIQLLTSGPQDIWITIPEGWRREQIAARLQANLADFSPDLFLQLTATLEGRLFPDSYLIPASASPPDVVAVLTRNFSRKTGLDPGAKYDLTVDSRRLQLTGSEILTLASLIEREAKNQSERENIAAILVKRLSLDWPLQIDASVQYARDNQKCSIIPLECNYWEPVLDTHLVSSYNTYLHPGLPPGAIANPGLAAISAVRSPKDTPYFFYLTGTDGITRYAKNMSEHQLNIDKYLRP
jgi:UPF0755 protein